MRAAQWRKWSRQDASKCLEGCSSSDERSDMWPNWDDATWTDAWKYSWVNMWDKASTDWSFKIIQIAK